MKLFDRTTLSLLFISAFAVALLLTRMLITGQITFIFLVWNLFLAWIPFMVAKFLPENRRMLAASFLLMIPVWLLFLPNAPYILTDLIHLKQRALVPYWFDLVMISSFAFSGLLLGWISMAKVQDYLMLHVRPAYTWLFIFASSIGTGFGIYIGRVLRWNSWDIISSPIAILKDVARPVVYPQENLQSLAVCIAFGAFFFVGYVTLRYLPSLQEGRMRADVGGV